MKLVICGDMSVGADSLAFFEKEDARGTFGNVMDIFQSADRTIVNLECALTDSEEGIKKCGPCLKGPISTAMTLKKAGVTDCTLSNNHIFDFGKKGLFDTLRALDDCGILWTGIGENYEASRKNHLIEHDGLKISIVNVCEHEYSYATETRIGARPFDEFETMEDIRQAKKTADYVIVVYHGGKEFCRYPSPRLRKACKEMVRCGADVVLCQHSHCIGCYEQFDGAHILYGQGNFHFAWNAWKDFWYEGLVVTLDVTKEKINIDFTPILVEEGCSNVMEGEKAQKTMADFWERSEHLKTNVWKEKWHDFCVENHDGYKRAFCGYTMEDDEDKRQLFSHYLDCEAHTDVWRELFPTWNKTNETD
ncbi:MAG: CapA family protein [Clostridia bacterium]|nr:CapA family protein [Clostridia bacterium]